MRLYALNLKWMTAQQTSGRVIRQTTIAAGVGALGGALFGSLFAGFMILLRVDSYGFSGVTCYFAACGIVAGVLLGVSGGLLEGETEASTEPVENAPRFSEIPTNRIASINPIAKASLSQQRNRLAEHSRTDRPNVSALVSQIASRN